MPRESAAPRSQVLMTPQSKGFYAAATGFDIGKSSHTKPRESGEPWQMQAWDYYDTIPEFHYAVNWVGNLLSRATLVVKKDGEIVDPDEDEVAKTALEGLFGGREGQREMFRQCGIHFTVAGEAYILGIGGPLRTQGDQEVDVDGEDEWFVVAATEVSITGENLRVWGMGVENSDRLLIRLWRPHPRIYKKSDSPTRAALPILEEILKLSMHIAAELDSRLASAGILFLPSEMEFSGTQQVTVQDENGDQITRDVDGIEGFTELLTQVASTAIKNRQDASALVPIIVQVPSDTLEKVHHLTFWTGLDENSEKMRTEAIRRLSLGLDMPPEVLTGTGDMNHWGAWQVDESAIKSHSEPLLQTITSSLTSGYLRGLALSILGDEDEAGRYSFGADTSEMRMRPNRSKESIELYNLGAVSKNTMLRENGFDVENDAMGADEFKEWMRQKVASGSTTPELVEAALREAGVLIQFERAPEKSSEETQEARPAPSLKDHPVRDVPQDSTLVAAAEVMVYSALKRAGNKLKNKMQGVPFDGDAADRYLHDSIPTITASAADDLLEGSWDIVERYDYGVPARVLQQELHSYTKNLLTTRTRPNREHLAARLATIKEA